MKCRQRYGEDDGVSPVVGVMLMLVVTIIIAAVVSAFSGGLMESEKKTPTLSMDIDITNSGTWAGSGFSATVLGSSEPISTNELKISTAWSIKNSSGVTVIGGATVMPGVTKGYDESAGAPYGFGPGIEGSQNVTSPYNTTQYFGNYTLMAGTSLIAAPWGAAVGDVDAVGGAAGVGHSADEGYGVDTRYEYTEGTVDIDAAEYILGEGWEELRAGDSVQVTIIHIPTGKVIVDKAVKVRE